MTVISAKRSTHTKLSCRRPVDSRVYFKTTNNGTATNDIAFLRSSLQKAARSFFVPRTLYLAISLRIPYALPICSIRPLVLGDTLLMHFDTIHHVAISVIFWRRYHGETHL